MLSNPGKRATNSYIPDFVKDVMALAFNEANIMSGFKNSGIHPLNPEIFSEEDFLCCSVTDREIPIEYLGIPSQTVLAMDNRGENVPTMSERKNAQINRDASATPSIPSTSTAHGQEAITNVTPRMIKPNPKAWSTWTNKNINKNTRKG